MEKGGAGGKKGLSHPLHLPLAAFNIFSDGQTAEAGEIPHGFPEIAEDAVAHIALGGVQAGAGLALCRARPGGMQPRPDLPDARGLGQTAFFTPSFCFYSDMAGSFSSFCNFDAIFASGG